MLRPCIGIFFLFAAGCSPLTPYSDIKTSLPVEALIEVDGQSVHVERRGAGEPVLLIHGFGGSTYCWRDVMPRLAEGFDVIALDLNGFGYTERPRDPAAYTYRGQADLVLGVMDELGVASAHVVGHSYGGGLALQLAAAHGDRVRSLTVVAGTPPGSSFMGRAVILLLRPLVIWYVQTFYLQPGPLGDALRSVVVRDEIITPEVVDQYLRRLRVQGFADAVTGLTDARNPALTTGQLGDLDIPALLIWGERDPIVPPSAGETLDAVLPRSRLVVLPGVGHLPMSEAPEEFTAELRGFLADSVVSP